MEFDPIPKIPSGKEASVQLHELDHQVKQLQKRMIQYCPLDKSLDHLDHGYPDKPTTNHIYSNRVPLNSTGDEFDDVEAYKKEIEKMRRQNNKLVLEAAYLKNENSTCERRLREEALLRESLQEELQRLARTVESNERYSSHTKDENYNLVNSHTENIELLNEQLQIYQQDFVEERRECEKLRVHNKEIEAQLEEAKETLERQQKKLLLYSQLFSNPIRTHVNLSTSTPYHPSSSKSSTAPSSPQYSPKEHKQSSHRLTSRHHKSNDHIVEATISSSEERPRRKYSQPLTSFNYESFDWNNDKEFISKGVPSKKTFTYHL